MREGQRKARAEFLKLRSRQGAHLSKPKDEKYNVIYSTLCIAGDLTMSPGAHIHTRAPSLHLPLVLDTSWDACSKHLELGCSGIGRIRGPGALRLNHTPR